MSFLYSTTSTAPAATSSKSGTIQFDQATLDKLLESLSRQVAANKQFFTPVTTIGSIPLVIGTSVQNSSASAVSHPLGMMGTHVLVSYATAGPTVSTVTSIHPNGMLGNSISTITAP